MSKELRPIITNVGITALIDAKNRGLAARITHVAVGDGARGSDNGSYVPTPEATALKHEIQRSIVAGGELFGLQQNQLHLTATIRDAGDKVPEVYPIYEIGFFLESGELFALYASPDEKLAEKVAGTDFVLAFDLVLTGTQAEDVVVDGSGVLDLPAIRDNLLTGDRTVKIHTQEEFDVVFNQGHDTVIPANATIVLSPIRTTTTTNNDGDSSSDNNGDDSGDTTTDNSSDTNTDNPTETTKPVEARPGYLLKNSIKVESNVSIIGFNQEDTVVFKADEKANIKIQGTEFEAVTGVRFHGWCFDGAQLYTQASGGAITLMHAKHCQLNCKLVHHHAQGNGGAIFGSVDVSHITAHHIHHCVADLSGGGVYSCDLSTFSVFDCLAKRSGSGVSHCQNSTINLHDCSAENCGGSVIFNSDGRMQIGATLTDLPLTLQSSADTSPVSITQNRFGGTATLELTTTDDQGQQASRLCLRGGNDNARIEFLQGANGTEQVAMQVNDEGNVDVTSSLNVGDSINVGGRKPFAYRRYIRKGDSLRHNTGVNADLYIATIAGYSLSGGDFNENGNNLGKLYMYAESGTWHVRANMPSHNQNENWSVDVLFTLRSLFDSSSNNQPASLE